MVPNTCNHKSLKYVYCVVSVKTLRPPLFQAFDGVTHEQVGVQSFHQIHLTLSKNANLTSEI